MAYDRIIKRDGRTVRFDRSRISDAIYKAIRAAGSGTERDAENITDLVIKEMEDVIGGKTPTVEQVQDTVEGCLMRSGMQRVAKAYILYRKQHADMRTIQSLMNAQEIIEGYVSMNDWMVKENSNMSYSLQGLNFYISSAVVSNYWLNKIYPDEIKDAHSEGDFHLHDLGTLGAYCVGWDMRDLLVSGFGHVRGKIASRPAKHFRAALGQLVNFFYTLQGEAAGAQAFSNFDTYLAPFIRHDSLSKSEVKQALQEFVFNMNVPTRVGFQTPFTNVTLDLVVPSYMRDEPVIIGGLPTDDTYKDFQNEMDIFNGAFAEVMTEGDAEGRVFTFPIPTYNIVKGFDWDAPVLENIFKMTAKYGIPYFSNFVNSDMNPEDARSMCCRLRLDTRELKKRGGGLFGANPLTGSVGVVSINMPRIGKLAKDEQDYFDRLDRLMDLGRNSLEIKREVLEKLTDSGLYPYSKYYLRDIKKKYGRYWKNHFATIGLIGLNESVVNFIGENIAAGAGRAFALKVLSHMRRRLEDYQLETNNIYNLEATPGEGISYRLARLDRAANPGIRSANGKTLAEQSAPYYTNSSQLPVGHTTDIFEALELQDEFQSKYTGGTVLHGFLGEQISDWKVARDLVRKIAENFKLPYFTITPTFSVCPKHGYMQGEHEYCPKCDDEIEGMKIKEMV